MSLMVTAMRCGRIGVTVDYFQAGLKASKQPILGFREAGNKLRMGERGGRREE